MRIFWKLVGLLFFARALSRGPRSAAGYLLRRNARRAAWRATRNWR